jgi:methylthioribulose-1-phosphate dehydratase
MGLTGWGGVNLNPAAQKISLTSSHDEQRLSTLSTRLAEVGRDFYRRDWVLGTSGNFSAVLSNDPLRLVITSSGIDKGQLAADHFLEIDETGSVVQGHGKPSAETLLHLQVVRIKGVGSVLHTHSVWSNVLSGMFASQAGFAIEGYEMLKGLSGVQTHEHSEWIPIIENSQSMAPLARKVAEVLQDHPRAHAFLLKEHGLYTWGSDIEEAQRHVEILEFLMQTVVWRMRVGGAS